MAERLEQITGVVLAGGRSSRFGSNKALASLGGRTLVERAADALSAVYQKMLLVTNSPEEFSFLGIPMISDLIPGKGPLSGLHAALSRSETPRIFLAACDMPVLDRRLIEAMALMDAPEPVIVPRFSGRLQPLHAIYSRSLLPLAERLLKGEGQQLKMAALLGQVPCRIVEEDEIRAIVGEDLADRPNPFVNINRRQELEALSKRLKEQG